MESICVSEIPETFNGNTAQLSRFMDRLPEYPVGTVNWQSFPGKPFVRFAIAYTTQTIFIKYYVREIVIRAKYTRVNDPVWKDSCVEFFVAPADGGVYYNFEINCIGTCLAEKGLSRSPREKLSPAIIRNIKRFPSLGSKPFEEKEGDFSWDMFVIIPVDVFTDHSILSLKDKTFRANFYKCGDALSRPHYLSWHPVLTAEPDFHRPEFFGNIKFC